MPGIDVCCNASWEYPIEDSHTPENPEEAKAMRLSHIETCQRE